MCIYIKLFEFKFNLKLVFFLLKIFLIFPFNENRWEETFGPPYIYIPKGGRYIKCFRIVKFPFHSFSEIVVVLVKVPKIANILS